MAPRKGPDGRTIKPADDDDTAATRKVQRKSIRDRIANAEEDADQVVTHIAGSGGSPTPDDDDATALTGTGGAGLGAPPATPPTMPGPTGSGSAPAGAAAGQGGTREQTRSGPSQGRDGSPGKATGIADAAPVRGMTEPGDENVTQVYRPSRPDPILEDGESEGEETPDGTISDPVVGWLVVVEGPGRGAALPIGYGNNRIGRAATEQICLDWGDDQVSRENHAIITYDGKHRKFYVQQGGGRNLTHVDDELVMVPIEVKGGEAIQMGQTKCRFVPFCGQDFDWQDE